MCQPLRCKIRIVFEQNESVYLPHALHSHYWIVDDNISQQNKTDSLGAMILLLISREFWFDFSFAEKEISELLQTANEKCKNAEYANKKVAKAVQNLAMKLPLTENQFCREFY